MKIQLQVPRILQSNSNQAEVEIVFVGETVGELLQQVQQEYPGLHRSICDETGRIRQHINLFVNDELWHRNQFETRLKPGDIVSVFQAVSGG